MEFANRSPGSSSQHHRSSCPYLAQAQNRPMPQSESFHSHAFGWGLAGQQPVAAPYHQWSAPPPATMEIPPPSQLRVPPASSLDPYPFISGNLPPPHQHQHHHHHQHHQPSNFRNTDVSYRDSGGMSSGHPAAPAAASTGSRFHHTHSHNPALPGQAPAPPSQGPQSAPHLPPSLQSQEQTQPTAPSHPPPHPNRASQHPPPHNPPTYSHGQPDQSASQQPPSGNNPSTSSAGPAPSLLSQQHQQHQHQQQNQQQYHSSMSGSNPVGSEGVPPQPARPPQVDPSGQYQNVPGQAAREQRQQRQPHAQSQDTQSNRRRQPVDPDEANPPLAAQPMNIPPHIPSLLNPSHLQHHYSHDYQSAYPENIPPPPANQRDLPRLAPPNVPPTLPDNRRRIPSSRSTRRSGIHAAPLSSERDRDRDLDDESSPASSPGSSIDHAIHAAHVRHGPNDRQLRAAQIFRGSVTSRKVASSTAISTLESVDVDSLSAAERSCVICYNDFGTETPEGVREAPLRLPKCRHVFGDHCIKKWFEESDSCPYCRTKVPSDTRFVTDSRALMEFMRARGQPPDANGHVSQEALLRLVASPGVSGYEMPSGTRRSPPSESGEHRRRMRPRHSAAVSSSRGDGPAGGSTRPLSFSAFPSSSNHSPPSRERYPLGEYPQLRAQDREREWVAMHMSRASARHSQPRASSNMYHPYSWEESPLVDPSGRLPIPPAGGLPPMPGFPAQHPQQHSSVHRATPSAQPAPYTHSMELRSQREASTRSFNPSTSGFNSSETNASSMDMDIPMPDRDSAP